MCIREVLVFVSNNFCRVVLLSAGTSFAQAPFLTEIIGGSEIRFDLRYRMETLNEDNSLKDATVSTLRNRLGLETGEYRNFRALIELEDIHVVGDDHYNSIDNGNSEFSTILDPEGTALNRAYIDYQWGGTSFRYGRQRIAFDNARFLGNADWRQNERTLDGLLITNTSFPGSRLSYAYMTSVQGVLDQLGMDSHFLNYRYQQLNGNVLSVYGYLLELTDTAFAAHSNKTVGIRYKGMYDFRSFKGLYTLEYADQSMYAGGDPANDAEYALVEFGLKYVNEWVSKIGIEMLGGNGQYALQVPLGTLTAFNGQADIFAMGTPAGGLIDTYVNITGPVAGSRLDISYHVFSSDENNVGYGREVDMQLLKRFNEHCLVGAKYAQYSAENFAVDTRKLSLWVELAF